MNTMIVDYFANYIKDQLGIVYERSNYYQLEKRLEELAKHERCANLEDNQNFRAVTTMTLQDRLSV